MRNLNAKYEHQMNSFRKSYLEPNIYFTVLHGQAIFTLLGTK